MAPTRNWRFAAQDCRQAAYHGTTPTSSNTSCFLGSGWGHLGHRLCEVAPQRSWPITSHHHQIMSASSNSRKQATEGGGEGGWEAVWGTQASVRGWQEARAMAVSVSPVPKPTDTQLQRVWLVVACWGTVATDGVAVFRDRERERLCTDSKDELYFAIGSTQTQAQI